MRNWKLLMVMSEEDKKMTMKLNSSKILLMNSEEKVWLMKQKSNNYKKFSTKELNKQMKPIKKWNNYKERVKLMMSKSNFWENN